MIVRLGVENLAPNIFRIPSSNVISSNTSKEICDDGFYVNRTQLQLLPSKLSVSRVLHHGVLLAFKRNHLADSRYSSSSIPYV